MGTYDAISSAPKERAVTSVKRQVSLCGATLLVHIAIFYAVIALHQPPRAVATDAPLTEFSSGRAMQHLRMIAQTPHPVGSPAHDSVHNYIVSTLSELKLTPEVQSVDLRPSGSDAVTIRNILARLGGEDPDGRVVMLMAHYDSVPQSYGASDDGAGVVVLLETLRALISGSPLKKDIIALFTDGEELGQLGATAFIQQRQNVNSVGPILNFEARGSRGPAFMFETSARNGILIREFARAAPSPFSSSVGQIMYEASPNNTDLTVFKRVGYSGLNFAFIDAAYNYHTTDDSLETIDERSVQHHGSYALALARHFGNLKLESFQAEDVVYFDLLGKAVIFYSKTMAQGLTICNMILFAGIAIYAFKRRRLTPGGVALGALAFVMGFIATAIIVTLAQEVLNLKHGSRGVILNDYLYFICFIALTVSVVSSLYLYFKKWASSEDLSFGTLLIQLIVLGIVTAYLPGASYALAWPSLFVLLWVAFRISPVGRNANEVVQFVSLWVYALPTVTLLLWTTLGIFQGVSLNYPVTLVMVVTLFLGFLLPVLNFLAHPYKWLLPSLSVLAAVVALALAVAK